MAKKSRHGVAENGPQPGVGWRNRIVDHAVMPVSELLPNAHNWRKHPAQQAQALAGTLEQVGLVQSVVLNRRSQEQGWPAGSAPTLVDGHLRVELAQREGEAALPVAVVDLSPDEEALVLATLDPLGAMAEADPDVLAALLDQVPQQSGDLQELLDALAEDAGIESEVEPSGEDPGPQMDRAAELQKKWGTERGQLWLIRSKTAPAVAQVTCPHCGCCQRPDEAA